MKIRVGYGLGIQGLPDPGVRFGALVDALEELAFDSLWLSERVTGAAVDPVVGMAFAAGRTKRLKLGTSVLVLPGRNPVLLAKELASLDVLCQGRLLPAVGLGVADASEQQAFAVARDQRASWFDEALPLIRRLWTEDAVDHDGPRFPLRAMTVRPRPFQTPPDVWMGGRAPSELRRVGRLGDGWLPSFCTPEEARAGRRVIEQSAAQAQRTIDDEHFGVLLPYAVSAIPDRVSAALAALRPGVDPRTLVPAGMTATRAAVERFVEHGVSKFVLVPVAAAPSWEQWAEELGALAGEVLPLQH